MILRRVLVLLSKQDHHNEQTALQTAIATHNEAVTLAVTSWIALAAI
jgi:hypothetical protein